MSFGLRPELDAILKSPQQADILRVQSYTQHSRLAGVCPECRARSSTLVTEVLAINISGFERLCVEVNRDYSTVEVLRAVLAFSTRPSQRSVDGQHNIKPNTLASRAKFSHFPLSVLHRGMRLLETSDGRTYSLTKDFLCDDDVPAYAILSHTWVEGEEVTLDDLIEDNESKYGRLRASLRWRLHSGKKGYGKLRFCAKQAKRDGLRYFWVDTCCIDKKNHAELQSSINSMFRWYQNSARCYVYLSDVSVTGRNRNHEIPAWHSAFAHSRWFTRGWTLQELLAPTVVEFFSREGVCLGSRLDLMQQIHDITDIPIQALSGTSLDQFRVDERLSWAAGRQTTREEDEVYSLIGIFRINLPFIYDEGYDRALRRLLEEIAKSDANPIDEGCPEKFMLRSTVPFVRDSDFINRDSLGEIQRICTKPAARAALVGLGGVGKSQIAIEYAHWVLEKSPDTCVFWLHAQTPAGFREGYYEIARKIKIDGWDDPKVNIVQLVNKWLRNEANGRWLMVIDNADDASVFVHDTMAPDTAREPIADEPTFSLHLPRVSTGSILVTSRNREVAGMLTGDESSIIEVGPMSDQEAVALVQRKSTYAVKKDDADALVEALDHMPLALTQALAFVNRTPRMTISEYLKEIGHNRARLLSENIVDIRRYAQASNSIMATWQISFEYIRERFSAAARLLSLMSFFDRQSIPESLLRGNYGELESESSNFEDDLYTLTSFCLVKSSADKSHFEMHALVQLSMKKWLALHNELENWKNVFVTLMDKKYPVGERENWVVCQKLLPHALAALGNVPKDGDAIEAWASLSLNVGWYLGYMGQNSKAHKLVLDSFEVREILLGPNDPETLDSLNSLGIAQKQLGQYEKAKATLRKALDALQLTRGKDHSATLTTTINLASVYNCQTQWIEAERLLLEVLDAIDRVELGMTHSLTLDTLALLSSVYRDQGRWSDAAKLDRQLLEAHEAQVGTDAALTLIAKSNLAFTYRKMSRLEEAEEMQLQIIQSSKGKGGSDLDLLGYRAHLAQTYRAQDRLDDAEELELQIVEVSKAKLGIDHVDTLNHMASLAATYWKAGKLKEAQKLDVQVLEMRKTILGEDHISTLDSKGNLVLTYRYQGLFAQAEELGLEVLEDHTRKLGENHPMTLHSKVDLASTYREQGRLLEAEKLNEEALKASIEVLGPDHPDTLSTMSYLALVYRLQKRTPEAVELLEKCCKSYERVVGPDGLEWMGFKKRCERWKAELV